MPTKKLLVKKLKEFPLQLFDLDDTLINTCQSYLSAYYTVFQQNISTAQQIPNYNQIFRFCRHFGSSNPKKIFEFMGKFYVLKFSAPLEQMSISFWQFFWQNLKPFDYVLDYLEKIKTKQCGIISNGHQETQLKKLEKTGLKKYFCAEKIYISSAFPQAEKKPSPKMILKMLENTGFLAEETVFYGNADSDLLAGKLAGVFAVLIRMEKFFTDQSKNFIKANFDLTSWKNMN